MSRRHSLYFAIQLSFGASLIACGSDLVGCGTGSARVEGCFAFQATDLHINPSANDSAKQSVFEFTDVIYTSALYPADSLGFVARGRRGLPDSTRDKHRAHWRPAGDDKIVFVWHDGFWGPVFRLTVRGDTLRGSYYLDTDARPVWPAWPSRTRAMAVRVSCA